MLFRRGLASFLARTNVAPKPGSLNVPSAFTPKSVVMLATPHTLPTAIENAITLHQMMKLQVVVAGVDSVVPNGQRNGISELWMADECAISNSVPLAAKDKQPELRKSDGVNPVGAKVHWKHVDATLALELGAHRLEVALANTAFATSTLATLFFFQSGSQDPNVGQTLADLTVRLPALDAVFADPETADRWTPLDAGDLLVTKCTGNLIKGLNGKPAASFLENNERLMAISSKDTKVYVKVYRGKSCQRYEVIAGGGGWGAKADLLALSPDAKVLVGDKVEFYMVTPERRYEVGVQAVSNQFLFECTPEETSYDAPVSTLQLVDHLFGCGSEQGFALDGVSHRSAGEAVAFKFQAVQ